MKIQTVILAIAILSTASGFAMAQNTLSPANQARPGQQGDDSSKPNGLQNNAGTGLPAKAGTSDSGRLDGATTGAAPAGVNTPRSSDTNVSPASPNASEQQPSK
jgi:hypothetical protein